MNQQKDLLKKDLELWEETVRELSLAGQQLGQLDVYKRQGYSSGISVKGTVFRTER